MYLCMDQKGEMSESNVRDKAEQLESVKVE